jgi:hypothetical protein
VIKSDPKGIPPIILKNCASAFAKPKSLLFNRSMATSVFSDRWKVSYVTLKSLSLHVSGSSKTGTRKLRVEPVLPFYDVCVDRVERVQKRFIRYALRGLGWTDMHDLPPYMDRCALLHLDSLAKRQ